MLSCFKNASDSLSGGYSTNQRPGLNKWTRFTAGRLLLRGRVFRSGCWRREKTSPRLVDQDVQLGQ
ncbi:hypothetical protein SAMN04490181_1366 [Pseudomonas brenneri]|uniref:Uncharacterized protein n=1 Tax=Pseudomonas brenneri TaxID=129817 RepID=A0ABY0W9V0_9PSED|nr:hypothetical protein SAMN04490181_1366 [Pseudomonas brenneri]